MAGPARPTLKAAHTMAAGPDKPEGFALNCMHFIGFWSLFLLLLRRGK
jgi:hypothetical protein